MDDLYLHVQLVQSEARLAVEDGLEVGNGEEEDRPELDAQMRSPPVLQATKTPTSVGLLAGDVAPRGPDGLRAAPPPAAAAPPPPWTP
jgi:hypothetical protein